MYLFQQSEVSPISKKYSKSNTLAFERFNQGMGAPILFGIVFFFVVCLGCADTIKTTVMVIAVCALLVIAARFRVLRERIHWPFIALTLYVIMDGVSTFYAVSGKFALREFLKVFLSYLLAVILLATAPKKEETTGKRIATILAVCTAFGSLVSIDLISTRWISGAAIWILKPFTEVYSDLIGVENGRRITSLFSNSNVFAGFSGIGALLSLGLSTIAESRKERSFFLPLLFINTLAFILSLSIGAIVFFFLALVVFFAVAYGKDYRSRLFVLMLGTMIIAMASAALIAKTSLVEWTGVRWQPLVCCVAGAALLCAADAALTEKFSAVLKRMSKKRTWIAILVLFAVIILILVAALCIRSSFTVEGENTLLRALYLKPGDYALDVQSDAGKEFTLRVWSQSQSQAMMHKRTWLLNTGKVFDNGSIITVPEDSIVVYFEFSAEDNVTILSATCGDQEIPLRYLLMPEFIVKRLQGVFANQNSIQRLVFFSDGLKLFRRSPIVGLGMGAFENGIKSVQSFYYETKYAHNHYFQTMLETGVIGLILFLSLLVSSAVAILKSRKNHPYAPALCAVLLFMAGQAIHDVVFSSYAYLPVAIGAFALMNICCGEAISKPVLAKTAKTVSIAGILLCTIVYCFFLAGNIMARQQADRNRTIQALVQSEKLDKFEWADYALPYVVNATGENINPYVLQQADVFAERLKKVDSNTIPIYLAEYFFSTDRIDQGIAMVEKYVDYVSSDQSAWQKAFAVLCTYDDGSETYREGVLRIAEKLETWNSENMGSIELSREAKDYIAGKLN